MFSNHRRFLYLNYIMTTLSEKRLIKVAFYCKSKKLFNDGLSYLESIGYKKNDDFKYGQIDKNKINCLVLNNEPLNSPDPKRIFRGNPFDYDPKNCMENDKNWTILTITSVSDIASYLGLADPQKEYIFSLNDCYEFG